MNTEAADLTSTRRAPRLQPWVVDVLVAGAVWAVTVLDLATRPPLAGQRPSDVVSYLLVTVMTAPFVLHRRFPFPVLAVVLLAELMYALGHFTAYPGLAAFVLLFGIAAHRDRRTSLVALVATALVMSFAVAAQPAGVSDQSTWITTVLATAVAWLAGRNLRNRRGRWDALEERARMLEKSREERARQAVVEERLRIARELHDVVAHSMSVIAVQSAAGHHVIDTQPEEARRALSVIETTSRGALTEMRRMLGVLREDEDVAAELTPSPGLADVVALVADVDQAGVETTVTIVGEPVPLPAGVDLSCYRIVQESLTNVIKHGGAHADVRITYSPTAVEIEVVDGGAPQGRGQHVVTPGHGLVGMRERVGMLDGRLSAGPRPGGGFRVVATLPTGRGSS